MYSLYIILYIFGWSWPPGNLQLWLCLTKHHLLCIEIISLCATKMMTLSALNNYPLKCNSRRCRLNGLWSSLPWVPFSCDYTLARRSPKSQLSYHGSHPGSLSSPPRAVQLVWLNGQIVLEAVIIPPKSAPVNPNIALPSEMQMRLFLFNEFRNKAWLTNGTSLEELLVTAAAGTLDILRAYTCISWEWISENIEQIFTLSTTLYHIVDLKWLNFVFVALPPDISL